MIKKLKKMKDYLFAYTKIRRVDKFLLNALYTVYLIELYLRLSK